MSLADSRTKRLNWIKLRSNYSNYFSWIKKRKIVGFCIWIISVLLVRCKSVFTLSTLHPKNSFINVNWKNFSSFCENSCNNFKHSILLIWSKYWNKRRKKADFTLLYMDVCICIWEDGKGCEHELVLTSPQLLSDTQTGSHCHMTEILAPCPIAQRASYVCCQQEYRPSHSHAHIYIQREVDRTSVQEQSQKKGMSGILLFVEK